MKDKNLVVPGTHLVLMRDNQILLLKRANTGHKDGQYSMVSGHVEQWENFTDAISREAKEEAWITVKRNQLEMIHVQNTRTEWYNHERINIYFLATEREWEIQNMEPHKCDELSRFDINNLPENMIDWLRSAIENIKNKTFYSEFGR